MKIQRSDINCIESECPSRIRDKLQREYNEKINYHRRIDPENFWNFEMWHLLIFVRERDYKKYSAPNNERYPDDEQDLSRANLFLPDGMSSNTRCTTSTMVAQPEPLITTDYSASIE